MKTLALAGLAGYAAWTAYYLSISTEPTDAALKRIGREQGAYLWVPLLAAVYFLS